MKKLILILLLAVGFASCKKKATVWESDWSAPVINDTLTLADLVNDSTLVETPGGFYELDLFRSLYDLDVNEIVEIPDTTIKEKFVSAFINLTLDPGTSFVSSSEEHDLALDDLELKKIILKEGYIDVRVLNPVQTTTYFQLKLPGVEKDGIVFNNLYSAPPGTNANPGVTVESIDLSGYELDLTGINGNSFNKLVSEITATTDPNGPQVLLTNQDTTLVEATFHGVKVAYARGYFGSRLIEDVVDVDLSALDVYESGTLDLSAVSLAFEIENGVKISAEGTLNAVSNENAMGNVVALTGGAIGNAFAVDPATGTWNTLTPSVNTLTFNSGNSNIEAYLENLGVKHTIDYSLHLNPWGNTTGGWDQVFPNSTLKVNLRAQMPLAIGMDDLMLRDTFDVDLNQDPEKTRIISGELILNASNGFPFSADITMILLDANGNPMHYVYGSEPIESSQYGTFDSDYNFNVANSEVHFVLSEEVVEDINEVKKIIVKSKFNSPDPSTGLSEQMIIPVDAFLGVKLKTKFKSENKL